MRPQAASYYSPFDLNTVMTKLRARQEVFPAPSFFSRRETYWPQAVIVLRGNCIELSQRKSFVNPWSQSLQATVDEPPEGGTTLRGAFVYPQIKEWMERLHAFTWPWTVAGLGCLAEQAIRNPRSALGPILSAAFLVVFQISWAAYFLSIRRRYRALAKDEHLFIEQFLTDVLQARQAPESVPVEQPQFQRAAV